DTSAPVTLQVGVPSPKYTWNLDDNPGWTAQGQWQHGVPAGLSGDPSAGFTGSNVYGYNLNGNYENNLPETHLTTTAIDCSNLSQVSLRFRRWLCIEPATYDHAYVRVSTDGINWTPVWSHAGSTLVDTSWQLQEFDIS